MTVARQVRVRGLVQGVCFRAWTRDEARRLGICGWVRNCPDGSVEAHIEGDEDSVMKMIEAMREGPSQARVDDVSVQPLEPAGISGFTVRY